jgi:aminopeptidase N
MWLSAACALLLFTTPHALAQDAPAAVEAQPGAAGIGDPLFPTAGNGGYDVQAYDLSIALDRTEGPIEGETTIRASATHALSAFHLDLHGLEVRSVEVDGAAAAFTRSGDELVITPATPITEGTEFTTVVRYGGVPEGVVDPSFPVPMKLGWIARNGEVYVLSQPTGAKTFFPCNDHPRDKARFTLRVTVPEPLTVVSNGTLADTIEQDGKRTFVYAPRDPIATYLVTIAIAAFEMTEVEGPRGMVIRNWFSPRTTPAERADFARTGEVIAFLDSTFGPYPFETCGNILASVGFPGALETQTLPTYGADAGGESIICHEQAHQWFGDAVSVHDWQDIWLNEGFAEYAAWMYLEHRRGRDALDQRVLGHYRMFRAMAAAQRDADAEDAGAEDEGDEDDEDSPGREPPPGRPNVDSLFGLSVYVRGPLALHALRTEVGDEPFLALMRSWVAEHRNGNARVADFLAHVERGTGSAARAVLERWIFDDAVPRVAAWEELIEKKREDRAARRRARAAENEKSGG